MANDMGLREYQFVPDIHSWYMLMSLPKRLECFDFVLAVFTNFAISYKSPWLEVHLLHMHQVELDCAYGT